MNWDTMLERCAEAVERLREKERGSPYERADVAPVADELDSLWAVAGGIESVHDLDRDFERVLAAVQRHAECWPLRQDDLHPDHEPLRIDYRWTDKVLLAGDYAKTPVLASYRKNPATLVRDYKVPHGVVSVSLAWWLLATEYEREAGLHEVLSRIDEFGALRKPDAVLVTATASRYGVASRRAVQAVHAAATHARTDAVVRLWDADKHGQLVMFPATPQPEAPTIERPSNAPILVTLTTSKGSVTATGEQMRAALDVMEKRKGKRSKEHAVSGGDA